MMKRNIGKRVVVTAEGGKKHEGVLEHVFDAALGLEVVLRCESCAGKPSLASSHTVVNVRRIERLGLGPICKPITEDGEVGFDESGQFTVAIREERTGSVTSWHVWNLLGRTCQICLRPWEPTGASLRDQVHWDLIDDHVHTSCLNRISGFRERGSVFWALVEAKLRFPTNLTPVANGYWPEPYESSKKPWYKTVLPDHGVELVVGMRKRVWSIEIKPTEKRDLAWVDLARKLFETEDVTKGFQPRSVLIHAWNDDKLREYVSKLASCMRSVQPSPP